MDNASKALIMAGAILIAVAIVGIGIYIFSAANGMTDDALNQIDALTVTSINSQLQQYEGTIRGREVKALLNTARSINKQNALPDSQQIQAKLPGVDSGAIPDDTSSIKDNSTYKVTFTYGGPGGYINLITIATTSATTSTTTTTGD